MTTGITNIDYLPHRLRHVPVQPNWSSLPGDGMDVVTDDERQQLAMFKASNLIPPEWFGMFSLTTHIHPCYPTSYGVINKFVCLM
jgi:hypothetical protein